MKCSHCDGPVSVRSRTCGRCGAPQDITVRHRQELDAKLGIIVRNWVNSILPKSKDDLPYDHYSVLIDHLASLRRFVVDPMQYFGPIKPDFYVDRYSAESMRRAAAQIIKDQLVRFKFDNLILDLEQAFRNEQFDLEHERVAERVGA